jgi:hypothetical protein
MWAIVNTTRYAAERTWVQDRDANKIWLVVVKATFEIQADGSCRLSKEQLPVLRMGEPEGEPGKSGLRYDGDLLGVKPCTDVLVRGSAWAPLGTRATSVDVQAVVGPIKKRLRVFGDRRWERTLVGSLAPSSPQPFESMPIVYERAYGGWDQSSPDPGEHRLDARNPVGTGFSVRRENSAEKLLPNIELPDQLIASWKDRPAPAGIGAVERHWSPRRELAGTYDHEWKAKRFPLWAEDLDARYHNCAPEDQQVKGFLRGGEVVDMVNLSPGGRLTFTLPRIYPFFETRFGTERVQHRAQLCTVIVEPDLSRLIMAWQTSFVCNHRVDELDATIVTEKRAI